MANIYMYFWVAFAVQIIKSSDRRDILVNYNVIKSSDRRDILVNYNVINLMSKFGHICTKNVMKLSEMTANKAQLDSRS